MQIVNTTNNVVVAENVTIADSFISRMVGLLNRSSLSSGEALIITRCQSIHMLFMKFAIDAIFMSREHTIVGLVENIKPFQLSKIYFKASYVIELPSGTIARSMSTVGDQFHFPPKGNNPFE